MSFSIEYNALRGYRLENDIKFSTRLKKKKERKRPTIKNGFLEREQQAEVQGKTPTYVRPNIYQEPDTNVVIFRLFTVEMKFIQICNLQTFL